MRRDLHYHRNRYRKICQRNMAILILEIARGRSASDRRAWDLTECGAWALRSYCLTVSLSSCEDRLRGTIFTLSYS